MLSKPKLLDNIELIKTLRFRRIVNYGLLNASFLLSKKLKRSIHFGMPSALSIEPTTACNLACPACPSGLKSFSRPTGKLELTQHLNWLKQLAPYVSYVNYYFQGEPFLHPQFLTFIKQAKARRIYTATSTNAHFIDAEKAREIVASGLNRLIISIDGLTQETYSSYRVNGRLSKVITASKHLVAAKRELNSHTPYLIFQFLVVQPNEHEIPLVHELADEIGIDEVRFKTAQLYDFENDAHLIPHDDNYSRYRKLSDGSYQLKSYGGNHCWRMWSSSVITWDGKVVPCCFDKDASHNLGGLTSETFKSIWKGRAYNQFRNQILTDRSAIDICTNCTEGTQVFVD